jgi:beta-N-acetylhexosaminidase
MGAISKHYEIEEAVLRAFQAGQDMLLICSRADVARRGYDALLQAARDRLIEPERIQLSLQRIAAFKSLVQPPLPFDSARFQQLSHEVATLNNKLNYVYGGTV